MKKNKLMSFFIICMALFMLSCSSDKMSKDDFIGTWKIDDVSVKIDNRTIAEPERSELGKITFDEGKVVSEGPYSITSSGEPGYIDGNTLWAGWEINEKTKQIKINGFLWTVRKIVDDAIELSSITENYGDGMKEYHIYLSKQ